MRICTAGMTKMTKRIFRSRSTWVTSLMSMVFRRSSMDSVYLLPEFFHRRRHHYHPEGRQEKRLTPENGQPHSLEIETAEDGDEVAGGNDMRGDAQERGHVF